MGELINGRTPEEIKAAIEKCVDGNCKGCAYYDVMGCSTTKAYDALAYIERLEAAQPKWISVKERLPEKRGTYLCNYEFEESGRIVMSCDYLGDKGWSFMTAHVTHWMPLPDSPKEDSDA